MWKRLLRAPLVWAFVLVFAASAAFGLYWFQPWRLFTDNRVEEALPAVAVPAATPTAAGASPGGPASPAVPSTPAGPVLLAGGDLVTHEHSTTGSVQLVRLADGRQQLLLRDLNTSSGPDLRVWLTDQPVLRGRAGWRVFDDGRWVELARLKGNRGNQAYPIPASVDIARYRSVTIWCRRFAVSFGAAELRAA